MKKRIVRSGIYFIASVFLSFGCAAKSISLMPSSVSTGRVVTKDIEVQIVSMTLSANAVSADIWLHNMSADSLTVNQKDIDLVDRDGGTVTPISGRPPEAITVPDIPRAQNWSTAEIVTFPIVVLGSLIALPVTLPLNVCCPQVFGKERSPFWPHPSWEPTYWPETLVAYVDSGSSRTVTVYFDRKRIKVDKLSVIRIKNSLTNEVIEVPVKTDQ